MGKIRNWCYKKHTTALTTQRPWARGKRRMKRLGEMTSHLQLQQVHTQHTHSGCKARFVFPMGFWWSYMYLSFPLLGGKDRVSMSYALCIYSMWENVYAFVCAIPVVCVHVWYVCSTQTVRNKQKRNSHALLYLLLELFRFYVRWVFFYIDVVVVAAAVFLSLPLFCHSISLS